MSSHRAFAYGLLTALLLGSFVRIGTLISFRLENPSFQMMMRTRNAISDAKEIVDTRSLAPLFHNPTQSDDRGFVLLALASGVFPGEIGLHSIQVLTLSMDLLALVGLAFVVRRWLGTVAGVVTAFLYALYVPLWKEIQIGDIQIYPLHFAVAMLVMLEFMPKSPSRRFGMIVMMAGMGVVGSLVRSSFVLFPVLLGLCIGLKEPTRKGAFTGLALAALFLAAWGVISRTGNLSRHPVAHHLFIGLGEAPNPYGLKFLDSEGWRVANETSLGVMPPPPDIVYSPEYLRIIRGHAMSLIAEDPGYYLRRLGVRVGTVLVGYQRWRTDLVGGPHHASSAITGGIALLAALGIGFIVRRGIGSASPLLLAFGYFSFLVVPFTTRHPNYYLAGSVFLLPFAAYAFAQLLGKAASSCCGCEAESQEWWNPWRKQPVTVLLVSGVLLSGILAMGGMFFVQSEAKSWAVENLARLETYESVHTWGSEEFPENDSDREVNLLLPTETFQGESWVLHLEMDTVRGRVEAGVFDATGVLMSPVAASRGPGRQHLYLGWATDAPQSATLVVRPGAVGPYPTNPLADVERRTLSECFRYYRIHDHAKLEFHPDNQVQVSASQFPNGHEDFPFRIVKSAPSPSARPIPPYWAARKPAWTRLTLPHQPIASRIRIEQPARYAAPMEILFATSAEGPLRSVELRRTAASMEIADATGVNWLEFDPIPIHRVQITFPEGDPDKPSVYVRDVSIPEEASFRVTHVELYFVEGLESEKGRPVRLAFPAF